MSSFIFLTLSEHKEGCSDDDDKRPEIFTKHLFLTNSQNMARWEHLLIVPLAQPDIFIFCDKPPVSPQSPLAFKLCGQLRLVTNWSKFGKNAENVVNGELSSHFGA